MVWMESVRILPYRVKRREDDMTVYDADIIERIDALFGFDCSP